MVAVEEASESTPEEATRSLLVPLRMAAAGTVASPNATPAASVLEDRGHAVAYAPVLGRAAPAWVEGSDTSPDVLQGERKQVTILCCAVADARGLAAHVVRGDVSPHAGLLGPGAARDPALCGDAHATVQRRLYGMLRCHMAHEDHARRAVLAALELQQRAHEEPARAPLRGVPSPPAWDSTPEWLSSAHLKRIPRRSTRHWATPPTWRVASSAWPAPTLF